MDEHMESWIATCILLAFGTFEKTFSLAYRDGLD